jgi:hypothetical protein
MPSKLCSALIFFLATVFIITLSSAGAVQAQALPRCCPQDLTTDSIIA